jgi:hypothetical protein
MSHTENLFELDAARRQAMISGDVSVLARILSDDLVWTHSSGKTEDKNAVLHAIESKSVSYESMMVDDYSIMQRDNLFIYFGTLSGQARRDGLEKDLSSKFLSVWESCGSGYKMLAWQSTGF